MQVCITDQPDILLLQPLTGGRITQHLHIFLAIIGQRGRCQQIRILGAHFRSSGVVTLKLA